MKGRGKSPASAGDFFDAPRGEARRKVAFIDKDGTLIENLPYNADPSRILLCRGVPEGLRLLAGQGYRLVVVSNQAGVALGFFPEEALRAVHEKLRELLELAGVHLDGFYYCPHSPAGTQLQYRRRCECRKPRAGLLLRAARELGADLARSWMIGDILDDIEAGRRAGCRTVLIDNGNETEWVLSERRTPDRIAPDFLAAARHVASIETSGSMPPEKIGDLT